MKQYDTILEARVAAHNEANELANNAARKLITVLGKYVGEKIVDKNNCLLQEIVKKLPSPPKNKHSPYYEANQKGSLKFVFTSTKFVTYFQPIAVTEKTVVSVGLIEDGRLECLFSLPKLRTDFTVKEIEGLREDFTKAQKH